MVDPLKRRYPDYLLDRTRVYSPTRLPGREASAWVGKPVTVVWQPPIFAMCLFDADRSGQPMWELIRTYGYVVELDKQIPSDELPRRDMRVRPKRGSK